MLTDTEFGSEYETNYPTDYPTDYDNYNNPTTSNYDDFSYDDVNRPVSSLDCFFDFGVSRNRNRQFFTSFNMFDWLGNNWLGSGIQRIGNRFGSQNKNYRCRSNDYQCRYNQRNSKFGRFGGDRRRGSRFSFSNGFRSKNQRRQIPSNCFDFLT